MKNFLSTLIIGLFLFSSISYAQTNNQAPNEGQVTKQPKFWWGPKVGVDLFTPTIDQQAIEAQVKSNFQVGFFLQFGRTFYFQPEFYYGMRKENYSGEGDVTINTIKVPLMFGIRLLNLKVISAHLMGGPSASFLIDESANNLGVKKSSFALQAGGGVDVLGFITLDVRYSVDLNGSTQEQIDRLRWDSGVNVTLGIKFR